MCVCSGEAHNRDEAPVGLTFRDTHKEFECVIRGLCFIWAVWTEKRKGHKHKIYCLELWVLFVFITQEKLQCVFKCKLYQNPAYWFPASGMLQLLVSTGLWEILYCLQQHTCHHPWIFMRIRQHAEDTNYNVVPTQQSWSSFPAAIFVLKTGCFFLHQQL